MRRIVLIIIAVHWGDETTSKKRRSLPTLPVSEWIISKGDSYLVKQMRLVISVLRIILI